MHDKKFDKFETSRHRCVVCINSHQRMWRCRYIKDRSFVEPVADLKSFGMSALVGQGVKKYVVIEETECSDAKVLINKRTCAVGDLNDLNKVR